MSDSSTLFMTTGGGADEEAQARELARRYRREFVDLHGFHIHHDLLRKVPVDLMFRYNFIPLEDLDDGTLVVGTEHITAPWYQRDEGTITSGFSYDLAWDMASRLGVSRVEVVPTSLLAWNTVPVSECRPDKTFPSAAGRWTFDPPATSGTSGTPVS